MAAVKPEPPQALAATTDLDDRADLGELHIPVARGQSALQRHPILGLPVS